MALVKRPKKLLKAMAFVLLGIPAMFAIMMLFGWAIIASKGIVALVLIAAAMIAAVYHLL